MPIPAHEHILALRNKVDLPPSARLQIRKDNTVYCNANSINTSVQNPEAPFKFKSSADYLAYKKASLAYGQ